MQPFFSNFFAESKYFLEARITYRKFRSFDLGRTNFGSLGSRPKQPIERNL